MKFFIVGLHSSGKKEVAELLKFWGIKVARLFSNLENPSEKIYNSLDYEYFTNQDINDIFENNAYVFLHELSTDASIREYRFYEGLSQHEFDKSQVFVLSPDQVTSIPRSSLKEPVCWIWIDDDRNVRLDRYFDENRQYDFEEREKIERRDLDAFCKMMYDLGNMIYFTNERAERIAAIIYLCIKHEKEVLPMILKNFN